jgi:hypothetical protein
VSGSVNVSNYWFDQPTIGTVFVDEQKNVWRMKATGPVMIGSCRSINTNEDDVKQTIQAIVSLLGLVC